MPSYNAIDEITRLKTENQQLREDKAELLAELYSLAFDDGVIKTDNILQAAADEIERLRTKQKIAVEMVMELLKFLEFIYNHPEFENSLKAYEWIMFQIEMIMAKYNEPVGEER